MTTTLAGEGEIKKEENGHKFSKADREYIRGHFITIEEFGSRTNVPVSVVHSDVLQRLFPKPTYIFDDGTEWYPPGYVSLMKYALRANTTFAAAFKMRTREALKKLKNHNPEHFEVAIAEERSRSDGSLEAIAEEMWNDYYTGEYGACLKNPVCGTIIRKALLVNDISKLISSPRLADAVWRQQLKERVNALDRLELPFAEYDRLRFGRPLTRDKLITEVKLKYKGLFS
jgi:Family of unknown function (DUF6058)